MSSLWRVTSVLLLCLIVGACQFKPKDKKKKDDAPPPATADDGGSPADTDADAADAADADTGDDTTPDLDTDPPGVKAMSPTANATDVAVDVVVLVTFDEALDPDSVSSSVPISVVDSAGESIAGEIELDDTNKVLRFDPTASLGKDRTYTVTVETTVKDVAGNALPAAVTWSFSTPARAWSNIQLLETNDVGSADSPRVAVGPDGTAHAVWNQVIDAVEGIWSSRYVRGTGWTTPELVHAAAEGSVQPEIVVDASGVATVVWLDTDNLDFNLYAARYDVGADIPGWGDPESIEALTGRVAGHSVSVGGDGSVFVIWYREQGAGKTIWSNRYDLENGWGAELQMDLGNGTDTADYARIGVDSDGNAIAVWVQQDSTPEDNEGFWWNRYTAGTGWGTAAKLAPDVEGEVSEVRLAVDRSGKAAALWKNEDSVNYELYAIWFSGTTWSDTDSLSSTTVSFDFMSSLSFLPSGMPLVVWTDPVTEGLRFSLFDQEEGWPAGTEVENADQFSDYNAKAVFDSVGNGVLAWYNGNTQVTACRFDLVTGCSDSLELHKGDLVSVGINKAGDVVVVGQLFDSEIGQNNVWGAVFD